MVPLVIWPLPHAIVAVKSLGVLSLLGSMKVATGPVKALASALVMDTPVVWRAASCTVTGTELPAFQTTSSSLAVAVIVYRPSSAYVWVTEGGLPEVVVSVPSPQLIIQD